jgi:alkylated DNA repair dioxygenase AlkB
MVTLFEEAGTITRDFFMNTIILFNEASAFLTFLEFFNGAPGAVVLAGCLYWLLQHQTKSLREELVTFVKSQENRWGKQDERWEKQGKAMTELMLNIKDIEYKLREHDSRFDTIDKRMMKIENDVDSLKSGFGEIKLQMHAVDFRFKEHDLKFNTLNVRVTNLENPEIKKLLLPD